jgi:ABC-type polysaccharide/polyol phosphate export systems, permease component
MYIDLSGKLGQSMMFNRALLAYPRVTFVDALIARLLLGLVTLLSVHCIVVIFILSISNVSTTFDFTKIVTAYVMLVFLATGIGTLNSFMILSYPIWQTAWAILNRPLLIISCIFFLFDSVPEQYAKYLWYNPLIHIVGMMRDGYYPFYHPNYVSIGYPILVGLITLMAGLFLLRRYHREMMDK